MKLIDKIAWIHIQDRKLLTTRSAGKNTWYIPGGKREADENDAEVLIREIKEELSVNITPQTIRYMGSFQAQADGHHGDVIVKMSCYFADFEGTLIASQEIEEFDFFTHKGKEQSSAVDKIIFDYLTEQDWID